MSDVDLNRVRRIESVWRNGPPVEREELIYGIARYVSKLGELSASDAQLRAMQQFFRTDDAVELSTRIRDGSLRFEGEWRGEFIAYFPAARDALPAKQMTEEEYEEVVASKTALTFGARHAG